MQSCAFQVNRTSFRKIKQPLQLQDTSWQTLSILQMTDLCVKLCFYKGITENSSGSVSGLQNPHKPSRVIGQVTFMLYNYNNPCWPTNRTQTFWLNFIFGHIACFSPPRQTFNLNFHRSTKGFSSSPGQVSPKTIEEVTLLQLISPPTSQKAEQCCFARLLAWLWHVSFMSEVPELLEHPVIIDKGPYQPIVVRGEQTGHTIGLRSTVQQSPFGVLFWAAWRSWTGVYLCEVEDVSFMVKHQPRAALVIPIHVVDPVTWVKINVSSDTGSDERHSQWAGHCRLIIKHLEFILMCMAKKLSSNCTFVSVNNVIVVPTPAAKTQARWDVTNDVYLNKRKLHHVEEVYCTD